MSGLLDELRFTADGLIPAIAVDADNGEVLMMAWMNRESLSETIRDGVATYWSRSRGQRWRKGDTSGHTQQVVDLIADCDGDTLLLRVRQQGVACHTGRRSCFYRRLVDGQWQDEGEVLVDPETVYKTP